MEGRRCGGDRMVSYILSIEDGDIQDTIHTRCITSIHFTALS